MFVVKITLNKVKFNFEISLWNFPSWLFTSSSVLSLKCFVYRCKLGFRKCQSVFRQKYPVVSHFKMLKRSLEQRSLAWNPVLPPPFPSVVRVRSFTCNLDTICLTYCYKNAVTCQHFILSVVLQKIQNLKECLFVDVHLTSDWKKTDSSVKLLWNTFKSFNCQTAESSNRVKRLRRMTVSILSRVKWGSVPELTIDVTVTDWQHQFLSVPVKVFH